MSGQTPRQQYHSKRQNLFSQIARLLTHRMLIVSALILLQLALLVVMVGWFSTYFVQFYFVCVTVSILTILGIVGKNGHPDYKLAWTLPIAAFPVFGGLFYLLFGGSQLSKRSRRQMAKLGELSRKALEQTGEQPDLFGDDLQAKSQSSYLLRASHCPPHGNTEAVYYALGEEMWQGMLEEIDRAEHFIFLEYFIIGEGVMWDAIVERLERKAQAGVDVRILYDDVGCLFTLPRAFSRQMEQMGIRCAAVNPFRPVVSIRLNNRDHRKICVIDGHTAFTGGINLADEYINAQMRYGHWKDTGILLRGEGAWNLTVMFLSTWDYTTGEQEDYSFYRPERWQSGRITAPGVVQPYEDNPLDQEAVGSNVYLNLISRATKYVYITTPYLVLDYPMVQALIVAAKAGIDVRIITPHIPDKKSVFEVTRANYPALLEAGVRIYEYTPGFIHAKTIVADGRFAVVGTINLDYRSLYLHFECGVWLYDHPVINDVERDFLETQEKSREILLEQTTRLGWLKRLWRAVLRLLAPLM